MNDFTISIDWPAPRRVRALMTTRLGGASQGRYASFNLATHCGDDPAAVEANRRRLALAHRVPSVAWLDQVHGDSVIDAATSMSMPTADAAFVRRPQRACAILTADCLPVLLCDRAGTVVAAAHCGWRGLASQILSALVARLDVPGVELLAWLGPAIGPAHYEIGTDVREALLERIPRVAVDAALRPSQRQGHWFADLYAIARAELRALGIARTFGGGFCTYADRRFYSYRRDGVTGRMAALIWLADD